MLTPLLVNTIVNHIVCYKTDMHELLQITKCNLYDVYYRIVRSQQSYHNFKISGHVRRKPSKHTIKQSISNFDNLMTIVVNIN